MWIIQAVMWLVAMGIGIGYLYSSIGGPSITYVSMDSFLKAVGACPDGICDMSRVNGCFLCVYIEKLFLTIGTVAEDFWNALVGNIWILLAVGLVIFLFRETFVHIMEQNKKNAELPTEERKFDLVGWVDKVWRQGLRVMIVGVLIGAIGWGGTAVMKTVSDVTITPVMYLGSEMAMAASGVSGSAQCGSADYPQANVESNAIGPALRPFMCVVGNLNTVILAGASGGFSLMNFSWMGLGGGLFTWVAGLALVILFLYIGFRLFFQILTVVFQLVFIIIFLPLIIAAWAFENTWDIAKGVVGKSVEMLVNSAIRIVVITLKIIIMYATVSYAADEFFPGPVDNYTAILPPGIAMNMAPGEAARGSDVSASIAAVFSKCEAMSNITGNGPDKAAFKQCFLAEKARVEQTHPGAFDFMGDGLSFILILLGLFFVYQYVVGPKVEEFLKDGSDGKFEFGKYVHDLGKSVWNIPKKIGEVFTKAMKK